MPKLLQNTLLILLVAITLITLAYFYIDKAVVYWAAAHQFRNYHWLDWFTYIPKLLSASLLLIYPALALRFCYDKWAIRDKIWAAFANSIVISEFLTHLLKPIFGRYWPETWSAHNLSLLRNQAYGFNWWHTGIAYQSFPSGHAAVTMAAATVIYLTCAKRLKPVIIVISAAIMLALITLYYHYVSDVIAGCTLGWLIGTFVTHITVKAANSLSILE